MGFGKTEEDKIKLRRLVLFVDAIEADIRGGESGNNPKKRVEGGKIGAK